MKSNISVGPPIDLVMVQADQFKVSQRLRLRTGDPYLAKMRKLWESMTLVNNKLNYTENNYTENNV
jgi:predicted proteasome-type protease